MPRTFSLLVLALTLSACSLFGTEKAHVHFRFTDYAGVDRAMLQIVAKDGRRAWVLDGNAFEGRTGQTRDLDTRTSGELKVTFALTDGTRLVSEGTFTVPLREDWYWEISFLPGPSRGDPLGGCFGCFGAAVFPLASGYGHETTDSLYVIWGGNSIKHPVVY